MFSTPSTTAVKMHQTTLSVANSPVTVRCTSFSPEREGVSELHFMLTITRPGESFESQLAQITKALENTLISNSRFNPVMMRWFLSDAANQADSLPVAPEGCACSIVEQAPLNGTKIALWLQMVSDMKVGYDSEQQIYFAIHQPYTHLRTASRALPDFGSEVATMALLEDYATNLSNLGANIYDNCVRTWFFVQNVDVNYTGVVKGRNTVFENFNLTPDTHFIASTGIGGGHANRRVAVQMDAYAISGIKPQQITYLKAPTHLNSTYEYGVAFERGVAIDFGDRRYLMISGTASIDNKGNVVHTRDISRQIGRMLENIETLLNEGGATYDDVAHMIIYLRDPADYTEVNKYFNARFPDMPRVIVHAPVCRPGWLIEMECMAIKAVDNPEYAPF